MGKKLGDWWDVSLNPVEGCELISEACENCWALAIMQRFRGQGMPTFRTYPHRLDILQKWEKPRRIFVGSLTDMLHEEAWPYLMKIIRKAQQFPRHTFVILTKRPHLIEDFKVASGYHASPHTFYQDNIWFGITAENQSRFDERISVLEKHPFKVRFISAEPLLGPIDLGDAAKWLNWIVVGGETGPKARPMHPDWVRSIRDQCVVAGVPFWFKHWGRWRPHGRTYNGPAGLLPSERWINYVGDNTASGYLPVRMERNKTHDRLLDGRDWSELPGVKG